MMQTKSRNAVYFLIMFFSSILFFSSCEKEEKEDPTSCNTENLTYDNYAKDFLNETCATSNCHSSTAQANSTFPMHEYEFVQGAINAGKILTAINRQPGVSPMPKGEEKLDDCAIAKMTAWIADGAPE